MLKSWSVCALFSLSLLAAPASRADVDAIANFLKLSVRPKTQIVFFGEDHRIMKQTALIKNMVAMHSDFEDFDCLFLEVESGTYQTAINDYMAGRASFKSSVFKAECEYLAKAGIQCDPKTIRSNAAQPILDTAKLYKLHVFAADPTREGSLLRRINAGTLVGQEWNYEQYYKRNLFTAELVKEAFKSGVCHRAAFQVGSNHVDLTAYMSTYRTTAYPLPKLLERDGLHSQAFLMSSTEQSLKADMLQYRTRGQFTGPYSGYIFYGGPLPHVYSRISDF